MSTLSGMILVSMVDVCINSNECMNFQANKNPAVYRNIACSTASGSCLNEDKPYPDLTRTVFMEQIKSFTQRDVRIDGEAGITVPQSRNQWLITCIYNDTGIGTRDAITVYEERVDVPLFTLLAGKRHLDGFSSNHASIGLIQYEDVSNKRSLVNDRSN